MIPLTHKRDKSGTVGLVNLEGAAYELAPPKGRLNVVVVGLTDSLQPSSAYAVPLSP
jgi:hypothetical protein